MSLIPCPSCNANTSYHAESCPQCGHPIRRARVRQRNRIYDLLRLGIALVVLLWGVIGLARDWKRLSSGEWLVAGVRQAQADAAKQQVGEKRQVPGTHPTKR